MKKKLLLVCSLLIGALNSFSQTKEIKYQELTIGSGIYFGATMNSTTITVTFAGPSSKWIALGLGSQMVGTDALIYTSSAGPVGWYDYYMSSYQNNGVTKDASQDWTIISNTVNGNLRTVVASRALNTGDSKDYTITYNNSTLNLIWARGASTSTVLSDHRLSNCGYGISLAWTLPDLTPPTLSSLLPVDNAQKVTLAQNLSATFNENIAFGTGAIELKLANGTLIESFDVATNKNVTINGSTLNINPTDNLSELTDYYVTIAQTAIKDLAGNAYNGITDATLWNFTTGDFINPTLGTPAFSPLDNANNVTLTENLAINFSENIVLGTGFITLKLANGTVVESYNVTSSNNLSVNGKTITINPTTDLTNSTDYYVQVDPTAVKDLGGNSFVGITDVTTWNFTTVGINGDNTPPSLVASPFNPADNSIDAPLTNELSVLFNETITVGTGTITVYKKDGTVVETIDITGKAITINGSQLTIHLTNALSDTTEYYVQITGNAIKDLSGNLFAGITDNTTWNFKTIKKVTASIASLENVDELKIMNNKVIVTIPNKKYEVKIYDLQGNTVKNITDSSEQTSIDCSNFTPAVYIIHINIENKSIQHKFIIH